MGKLVINKSLTYSGHKLQGRTKLYGMDISIENKKGSYRSGTDKDGHKWRTFMNYDYGYIRETVGTDGDHVDCYIGPYKDAEKVYVIHQNDPVTHKYDEDKCMLCFENAAAAKKAYMKQYDRPGFFGSMDIMTVENFKNFIFNNHGRRIHKSLTIEITDITEENKQQKTIQFERSLNALYAGKEFRIRHIAAGKNERKLDPVTIRIRNFDRNSIEKAVHKLSLSLDTDLKSSSKGEAFFYKAQEELTDRFIKELTEKTNSVYTFVINYFGLPEVRIVSKADLTYKGKVIYNPETGKPIKETEWKKFVTELEKFINKNYAKTGEKIVLTSQSLGRILERLSKTNSLEAIKKMSLSEMNVNHRNLDWISQSVKNMTDTFGDSLTRDIQSRIQVAIHSAAQEIKKVCDSERNDIQQIIIDGIKNRQSKSKISQNLFDKCVGMNRDFQRITDTEIQANSVSAYVQEEFYHTKEGEKVYFKRFEQLDDNTCKQCQRIKGVIALYSDIPLADEAIDDPYADIAIWEGKQTGIPFTLCHPYCRGAWFRYYPEANEKANKTK